jgi:hypothetical protein
MSVQLDKSGVSAYFELRAGSILLLPRRQLEPTGGRNSPAFLCPRFPAKAGPTLGRIGSGGKAATIAADSKIVKCSLSENSLTVLLTVLSLLRSYVAL